MLEIRNLHASVDNNEILRGIDLKINAGEVHAIMGPNGSGKSTLASVLAGRDAYDITAGEVTYNGLDLLDMDPEERAGTTPIPEAWVKWVCGRFAEFVWRKKQGMPRDEERTLTLC